MNQRKRIELAVAMTAFEIDVVSDYAAEWGQSLEEFLADAAGEKARRIAYAGAWEEDFWTEEEIEEFTGNYDNDRLIDFLRDAARDE